MSSIIKRNINGATYLYLSTSYRDSEGRPRSKHEYIGKLENGLVISKKRKLPAAIKKVTTIKTKFLLEETKPEKKIS